MTGAKPDHKAVWQFFCAATTKVAAQSGYWTRQEFPAGWEPANQAYEASLWKFVNTHELFVLTPCYFPANRQLTFILDRYFDVDQSIVLAELDEGAWPAHLFSRPQIRRQMGVMGLKIRPWHLLTSISVKFEVSGKPMALERRTSKMFQDFETFHRQLTKLPKIEARPINRHPN